MPKELKVEKSVEATLAQNSVGTARTSKYPYQSWLAVGKDGVGKAILLESPTDYEEEGSEVTGQDGRDIMIAKIKAAASRLYVGFVFLTKKDEKGNLYPNGGIALKPRKMTKDEREANDKDRARTAAVNHVTTAARAAAKKAGKNDNEVKDAARKAAAAVRTIFDRNGEVTDEDTETAVATAVKECRDVPARNGR